MVLHARTRGPQPPDRSPAAAKKHVKPERSEAVKPYQSVPEKYCGEMEKNIKTNLPPIYRIHPENPDILPNHLLNFSHMPSKMPGKSFFDFPLRVQCHDSCECIYSIILFNHKEFIYASFVK